MDMGEDPYSIWGSEVETVEVLGAPSRTFSPRPRHLGDVLQRAHLFGSRAYVVDASRSVEFGDLERRAAAVAAQLDRQGVSPGSKVMFLGRNSVEWVAGFWGCVGHGYTAVPANGWWTDEQLDHAISSIGPDVVLTDARSSPRIKSVRTLPLESLLTLDSAAPAPAWTREACSEDDLAVVLFTSGTSGTAKAVGLSHRSVIAAAHNIIAVRRASGSAIPPPSTALLTVPLFHIGAIQQVVLALVNGSTLAFPTGRFDAAQVLELIERHRISSWAAVPTMVSRVIEALEAGSDHDISSLRSLTMGASAVPPSLLAKVRARIPSAQKGLASSYGLTEAGGAVAAAAGAVLHERPGTVGRILRTVEVRIVEPDASGVGRIWVRSPSVMLGYLNSEDPDPIDDERWLDTGDVGWTDDDDYLYLEGRAKDIVIRGGENISCSRIERRLLEHPAVAEAAVVGLPDADLGEVVAAALVIRGASRPSEDELSEFAGAGLAYFEVPTVWWFRDDELPKTASGKILKRTILADWPPPL
jgi:long-chain acyl-CoA synthetase